MPCNCYWEKRAPNEQSNKRAICATYCAASINLHKRVRDFVGLTPGGTETMWARTRECSEGSGKAVRGARQEESAEDCQGETLLDDAFDCLSERTRASVADGEARLPLAPSHQVSENFGEESVHPQCRYFACHKAVLIESWRQCFHEEHCPKCE